MSPAGIDVSRREVSPKTFSLLREMRIEPGDKYDWEALHQLHYKAAGSPMGPHYWRVMLDDRLIGLSILSLPKLLLAGRHEVFPKLKNGQDSRITNKFRAHYVNSNFTVNSRTVVDTMFRAAGISYRMLNLAARLEGKQFVEIQSSMSRFNPFAMRAGFRFSRPRSAAAYEKGLKFMALHFSCHPADQEMVLKELAAMNPAAREETLMAMRQFYYRHSALEKTGQNLGAGISGRVMEMEPKELTYQLQQLVFASPMYGVYRNPDHGRKDLPNTLPLLAFDRQQPHQPLEL